MMQESFVSPHLTWPQGDDVALMQIMTYPGMAHWAGTGPAQTTCRECASWLRNPEVPKRSYKRDEEGRLCPRRCRKFVSLMRAGNPDCEGGPAIPANASSCRHFDPAFKDEGPALIGGRKAPKDAA